ncbi:SAF domain-containing protein [Erwinia sp. 9145]|uniref:SAF domain-containing protein n=1 Tax=Erwinia sp. 9145 TaxID=1500895 RepID=UPI000AF110C1|nr:SAF domain-containing protein [Erwinia sp. 9145]
MNQRLLMIIAVLLLVVGVCGLLLFSGEEVQEAQTVTVYTASKTLKKGEALTPENWTRATKTPDSNETPERMPESLEGYVAAEDIAQGAVITLNAISLPAPVNFEKRQDHFLYQIVLNQEDSLPIAELNKGELIDIYLRYYILKDGRGQSKSLVDREGKPIAKSVVKVIKLLSNKRFNALTQGDIGGVLNGKGSARVQLSIELNSEDKSTLQTLSHMGELLAYPANTPVTAVTSRVSIPETITEIRGRNAG